jgi:hypothetical protein
MTPPPALVVGFSEQLPNEPQAYHLMGTSTDGAVLLSRRGAIYSAAANDVCAYPALLERMLGLVLPSFPASIRERARPALIRRWNRDWGIGADGLVETAGPAANDNRSRFTSAPTETLTSGTTASVAPSGRELAA